MNDSKDRDILNIIQQDARVSNVDIAKQIGLAPSATLERIRKLEERGVIQGYVTKIDPTEMGFGLTAFISVKTQDYCEETDKFLAAIPEVLEVHDVAGEDSYLLKVRVKNTKALSTLLREAFKNLPNVISTNTTVVLETIKETIALPIEKSEKGEKAIRKKKK